MAIDPAFRVGEVSRRLFGTLVEPVGRCVAGGILEPGHPSADDRGRRRDVLALARDLGVSVVCYRTGERPDGAVEQYLGWLAVLGAESMIELGVDNVDLVGGRRAGRIVGLGHRPELDGVGPAEYAERFDRAAEALSRRDPAVELLVAGGQPAWTAAVLERCFDWADYVTMQARYAEPEGDLGSFLASATDLDERIGGVVATADHVRAKLGRRRRLRVALDEWSITYPSAAARDPSLEGDYPVAAAVVAGSLLISLLRHCDRVTLACHGRLTNALGAIRTSPGGPAWRQTIFYPIAHVSRHARGVALLGEISSPWYDTDLYGEVPLVDAVVTYDADEQELVVFAVNRAAFEAIRLALDLRVLPGYAIVEHLVLAEDDVRAANTRNEPDRVRPRRVRVTREAGYLEATLPPVSWNVIRLAPGSSY